MRFKRETVANNDTKLISPNQIKSEPETSFHGSENKVLEKEKTIVI